MFRPSVHFTLPVQAPTKVTCAEMYVLPAVRSRHHAAMALTLSDLRAIAEERRGAGILGGGRGNNLECEKVWEGRGCGFKRG